MFQIWEKVRAHCQSRRILLEFSFGLHSSGFLSPELCWALLHRATPAAVVVVIPMVPLQPGHPRMPRAHRSGDGVMARHLRAHKDRNKMDAALLAPYQRSKFSLKRTTKDANV